DEIRQLRGHRHPWILHAIFTRDGTHALSCGNDQTIRLWDIETGQEKRCFEGPKGVVSFVSLSPDGSRFLSTSEDSVVRVWELNTQNEPRKLLGSEDWPVSVAWSPKGQRGLSTGKDRVVR